MGVSVDFEGGSDAIEVVPGEQAEVALRLQNTGMVVDRVVLDVLGDAAEWARVEPAQVNLLPGATERVRITFSPPRAPSLTPGEVPFALRAMSSEDPEGSTIEEGRVRVAEFGDLGVQLVPKSATGRRSARFRLVVENRGNRPEPVRLEPFDPDARLGFKTRPAMFIARPGTATFVRVKTVPRKTFFRGPNRTLPFEIAALPDQGVAVTDEGVMLEKQVLPEWLLPLVAIAAAVCGVLFVLWFTVLRPVVNSAATAAGNASSAQAQAQNAAAQAAKAAANNKSAALTGLTVKVAAPSVLTGSTDLATANGTSANGTSSNPKVVWTSSDPNVATVSQTGVVTAVNPGTVTITATNATSSASPSAAANGAPGLAPDLGAQPDTLGATPGSVLAAPSVVSGSATVNVVGPVSVSTVALPQAVLGKSYSESLTGTGGTGAYTWSVSSGALPPGFTLSPDGVLTGTASTVGTTSFKVQLVNAGPPYQFAAKTFTLPVIDAPAVSTSSLPGATIGTLYSQTLTAVFGTAPYTWSLVPGQGSLPNGLVLNGSTGQLSGNPTTTGVFSFSVQVTDSAAQPQSSSQQLSIAVANPLAITTPARLPQDGVKGAPYSLTLTASGGTAPYTWSVTAGSLPLGLTLNSASGVITGIPTVSAKDPMPFTVQAVSTGPPAQTISKQVSLLIVDPPVVETSSLDGATTGTSYAQKLTAEFGSGGFTWTLVPGQGVLPDGLSLDAAGDITGTPKKAGTATFTVEATDGTTPNQVATQHLSIAVADPLAITTPAKLPRDGVTSAPYSATLTASGGTAPFTWSFTSGTLPLGLTLNPATGEISGSPTVSGTVQLTAQLVDSGTPTRTTTQQVSLRVVDPPVIATSSLLGGTTGDAYDQPLSVKFGVEAFTWSVAPGQGDLPAGLSINSATGEITGTPTAAGTAAFTIQAVEATTPTQVATQHLSIAVADPLNFETLGLPGAVAGTPYSRALSASGGTQPYTWSVDTGSLPAGLSLDPASGVISGTPTKAATSTFTVKVTDSGHRQRTATSQKLTLIVVSGLTVTTSSLPQGAVGEAAGYAAQLSATGGTGPYVWTATGTLPAGVSLDPGGVFSGTPTTTGVFPFTVQVTDGSSPPLTITQSLTITVVGSLKITTQSLADALSGQSYAQTLTATGGTAPYTWSVARGSSLPTGLTLDPVTGFISGTAQATAAPASVTITVVDTGPPVQTASRTFTLRVSSPLTFTMPRIPVAVAGQSFSVTPPPPSGGSGSYLWVETGVLPDGLALNNTTGAITGTVNVKDQPGSYPFKLTLNDQAGGLPSLSADFSITVVEPLAVPGSVNVTGAFGSALHGAIQASGGAAPYSFTFDSTAAPPPPWLSVDKATGAISGTPDTSCSATTPTTSGAVANFDCPQAGFTAHVTVTDSIGETSTVTVDLAVTTAPLVVDHNASATQTAGSPLNFSVGTVHGGYGGGTLTFTATGLPCNATGTNCDQIDFSTGRITGTLADFGLSSYTVTVTVTQDDPTPGSANTYVGQYTVTINTAAAPASASAGATP